MWKTGELSGRQTDRSKVAGRPLTESNLAQVSRLSCQGPNTNIDQMRKTIDGYLIFESEEYGMVNGAYLRYLGMDVRCQISWVALSGSVWDLSNTDSL